MKAAPIDINSQEWYNLRQLLLEEIEKEQDRLIGEDNVNKMLEIRGYIKAYKHILKQETRITNRYQQSSNGPLPQ